MTETNINALCSVDAVFDGVDIEVTVEFSAGGGTFEHDELTAESRAKANQHPIPSITGLQSALDGKANSSHVHNISDVTGLQSALDGKSSVVEHNDLTGRDAADVHPKESITGLKISDSPEFADTQITSLSVEATYTSTVWSYLVGLFTTVPKSALQHLIKLWTVVENLKSRVNTLETKIIADFTLPANQSVASFPEITIANLGIAQGQDFSIHVYFPALPDNSAQAALQFRFNVVDVDATKYYSATSDTTAFTGISGASEGSFIMVFRWVGNKVEGNLTTYRITSGTRAVLVTAIGTNGTWLTAVSSFIIRTTQIVTWPAGTRIIIKKM